MLVVGSGMLICVWVGCRLFIVGHCCCPLLFASDCNMSVAGVSDVDVGCRSNFDCRCLAIPKQHSYLSTFTAYLAHS